MAKSREDFWRRSQAIFKVLYEPHLQGQGLSRTSTNEAARLLRGGLMVQAYASLETFLRERVAEAMEFTSAGLATFAKLPSGLQDIAVYGALNGLRFRVNLLGQKDPQALQLVHAETEAIASTARSPYGFSKMMFGYDKSNLSPSGIREFLNAIGVGQDPWFHLTEISKRVGLGGLPLRDGLEKGYAQRNSAAHDAENQISPRT